MKIFKRREEYKPFEYPEVQTFIDAINKTFWTHDEVNFTADVQDFHANLSPVEQEVVKRSLLGIAQVEVGVKTFWGNLYNHMPKPEFNDLGATFAHNEAIHSSSYARLLEVLGLNGEFSKILNIPIFSEKLDLIRSKLDIDKDIIEKLLFFTIVIENASLFSQFANILSLTRFKGYMKNTSNIIAWTSSDEQIHANAGIYLVNEIKKELSEDKIKTMEIEIRSSVIDYINYESELIEWIFEEGELSFYTKENLLDFMKYRVDDALSKMNFQKVFNVTEAQIKPMLWFEEEVYANSLDDFFSKRPVDYTKHDKSIRSEDLF